MSHGRAQRLTVGGELGIIKKTEALTTEELDDPNLQRGILQNDFVGPRRFGMMLGDLDPLDAPDEALVALGDAMQEVESTGGPSGDSDIPAGFTYLGQFVDHDITFDKTVGFPAAGISPEQIEQARTPTLELDSLYGLGPRMQPELRDPTTPETAASFAIGLTRPGSEPGGSAPGTPQIPGGQPHDLPRKSNGEAVIGDPRNDENLIVAQLHLAFLKFHNKVLDLTPEEDRDVSQASDATYTLTDPQDVTSRFHRANQSVRWHYQWIVLHDFLPRIVERSVLDDVLVNGRKFFRFEDRGEGKLFMPLEFSAAAYRFGHSMIRESYNYNRVFASRNVEPNALTDASLSLLFDFTGRPGGTAPIPGNWVIDWRRFFEIEDGDLVDKARRIDPSLARTLHRLPQFSAPDPASLAIRNLKRGVTVRLPSGQVAAEAMGATPLTEAELTSGPDGAVVQQEGFAKTTPLWFYILKEADVQAGGKHLGELGSRIVAEVFVGLLDGDPFSFRTGHPDWGPTLPGANPGDFTMADLLRFVGDVNPIG